MSIYLGLGSNCGNKRANIEWAIEQLQRHGLKLQGVSPCYETPPLLPQDADPSWYKHYLNCVIQGGADWSAQQALTIVKQIESDAGRDLHAPRWSPRILDIDILLMDDLCFESEQLTIPHLELHKRSFVLSPLSHLSPNLVIPSVGKTVMQCLQEIRALPTWMGIVNLTPDSFSDGGKFNQLSALRQHITELVALNTGIIDLGAESTRPKATQINWQEEWQRLEPILAEVKQLANDSVIFPKISIDSRHWQTIEKAIAYGIDIVNDVTGLTDRNMQDLVKSNDVQVVSMHALTVPVDPRVLLSTDEKATVQLEHWLERQIENWLVAGLDIEKVIFDPGVGFGKNLLQTLEIMQNSRFFQQTGMRLLIGHSRKSFINAFSQHESANRDLETLGLSLKLCEKGVDIIRIHNVEAHVRAYRGWSSLS